MRTHYSLQYKKLSYLGDSAGRQSLRRSSSFEATDFGTNRKPMTSCSWLIVNLHLISHHFRVIAIIGQIRTFERGTSLQHIRSGWTPKLTTTKFVLKKLETSLYRVVQNIFRYFESFRRGSRVWRTDTDGRTESLLAIQRSINPH